MVRILSFKKIGELLLTKSLEIPKMFLWKKMLRFHTYCKRIQIAISQIQIPVEQSALKEWMRYF